MPTRRMPIIAVVLLLLLLLIATSAAAEAESTTRAGASKGLRSVMEQSAVAISRLHKTVSKYKDDLQDDNTKALLSDCADLTGDSQDAVRDSVSILVKLWRDEEENRSKRKGKDEDEMMDVLRTNLSAALTDITTCTDGLHDESTDQSGAWRKAARHIDKQADRASQLLSRALNLTASSTSSAP